MPPKRKRRALSRVSRRLKGFQPYSEPINDKVKPSKLSSSHSPIITEGTGNAMESDEDAVLTAESDEPLLDEEQLASLLNFGSHRRPVDKTVDIVGCPVSSKVVSSQQSPQPSHLADKPPVLSPHFPEIAPAEQWKRGRQNLERAAITVEPASVSTPLSLLTGVCPRLHPSKTLNPVNSSFFSTSTTYALPTDKSCVQQPSITTTQNSQLVDSHIPCSSTLTSMTRSQGALSTLSEYSAASSPTVHEWPLSQVQTTKMIKELTNRFNEMTTPANIAAIINYKKNPCVRPSGDIAMLLPYIMKPVVPNLCKCLICGTLNAV